MTLVVLVSLCAVLTLSYANPLNHHNCKINGKTYKNGVIIRVPEIYCNTYKCVDGYPSLLEKDCDFKNKCTPVNGTLVEDCITYTCFLYENGDERIVNMSSTKIMCEDKDGICRNPGTEFKLVVNDKLSDNCTCEIKENSIDYKCNKDICRRRKKPSV
ncbi:uncharacterized protein LOC106050842 isoform X2 [Biomphalaria glabrata]|uniref:Uncharacterized protein LOC106050842 isoform X2 n=1 Tax=Biomphalaria glabrata TaxID=6526 RepID=A0A9W2YYX9_BIOGL|nr:uncharacterized protein LOC106050842 isoform X2 [Biomphalaria glabrata]